jgi:uncharacterized protein
MTMRSTLDCDGETLGLAQIPARTRRLGSLLLMHGAGVATMERTLPLCEELADSGFDVTTFDFSGHGSSTGRLDELSLERRFAQACSVIDHVVDREQPLNLVGFSMSGQTVGDLLREYGDRVARIALCSPAVYSRESWQLSFNDDFTRAIRIEGAWRSSTALTEFGKFDGQSVLALPGEDSIIPVEVTVAIEAALGCCSARFSRLVVPKAGHQLGTHFATNEASRSLLVQTLSTEPNGDSH